MSLTRWSIKLINWENVWIYVIVWCIWIYDHGVTLCVSIYDRIQLYSCHHEYSWCIYNSTSHLWKWVLYASVSRISVTLQGCSMPSTLSPPFIWDVHSIANLHMHRDHRREPMCQEAAVCICMCVLCVYRVCADCLGPSCEFRHQEHGMLITEVQSHREPQELSSRSPFPSPLFSLAPAPFLHQFGWIWRDGGEGSGPLANVALPNDNQPNGIALRLSPVLRLRLHLLNSPCAHRGTLHTGGNAKHCWQAAFVPA